MPNFQRTPPDSAQALRDALYQGTLFLLPGTATSHALVEEVQTKMREELGDTPRKAQFDLSGDAFFERCGRLRKLFYGGARYHEILWKIMGELGFNPDNNAFEPMRLRIVAHNGADDPKAAPVYYGHRDTWYAQPQALITWWIPTHDLTPQETFEFFPEYFNAPAPNDSEIFDYDVWLEQDRSRKVGWQNPKAGIEALYPRLQDDLPDTQRLGFSCKAGNILLFSGSHLHQTRANRTGQTRFSLDFRTVHLDDHANGTGAPNVDNRSKGCALQDYTYPTARQ